MNSIGCQWLPGQTIVQLHIRAGQIGRVKIRDCPGRFGTVGSYAAIFAEVQRSLLHYAELVWQRPTHPRAGKGLVDSVYQVCSSGM